MMSCCETAFLGISEGEDGQYACRKFKPMHHHRFGGIVCLGKTCIVPEAMTDKAQMYSILKNMEEV